MLTLPRLVFAAAFVSSSLAAVFNVKVGADGLVFTPNSVTGAVAGDTITFEFHPKNHTLTLSSFAAPCTQSSAVTDSGFVPVPPGSTTFPTKNVTLPADYANTPLWFFCKQTGHCGQGMVFAINPGAKMDAFIAAAKATAGGGGGTTSTPPPATTDTTSPTDTTSAPATTSSSAPAAGSTIQVSVGASGQLRFSPQNVTANVGDTVLLTFEAGAHTFTQSTFAAPCSPMSGGFNSGAKPVTAGAANPTFSIVVNDTKPIWAYCQTGNHCSQGMVFAVNAPSTGNTFDAFQNAAEGHPLSSGTGTTTGSGPQQTAGGNGVSARFATGASGLLVAAMIAGLLM